MRLPEDKAVVLDRGNESGGIHLQVLRRLVDAELQPRIDALVLEAELLHRPERLLHVDGIYAAPDLEHQNPTACPSRRGSLATRYPPSSFQIAWQLPNWL